MGDLPSVAKSFAPWKIALAIFLGLFFTSWMLIHSLSQSQYSKTNDGQGSYSWVDGNDNGVVDYNDDGDFKKSYNGNYNSLSITESLAQIDWTTSVYLWLSAGLIFMIGRDFFYIIRIRLLTNNQLTWRAGFYVIMLWEFASAISPGVVGGAAAAAFILNRETIPFGKATAIVVITAFMDNLFFILMFPLVFFFIRNADLFSSNDGGALALNLWFWVGFSILCGLCLLLYISIFWFPKLAGHVLLFLFRIPFLKRWNIVAMEWGKDIERASLEFQKKPFGFWLKVFGTTVLSWGSRYLVINAILNAFLNLGFIDNIKVLGKQLVLWLVMLVSPTPGGSGVAEYAFGELLSDFGSSLILITTMAIIWRMMSYFPYLFIGVILLPSWIKRTR